MTPLGTYASVGRERKRCSKGAWARGTAHGRFGARDTALSGDSTFETGRPTMVLTGNGPPSALCQEIDAGGHRRGAEAMSSDTDDPSWAQAMVCGLRGSRQSRAGPAVWNTFLAPPGAMKPA